LPLPLRRLSFSRFSHTAPPETHTLSLPDALPISGGRGSGWGLADRLPGAGRGQRAGLDRRAAAGPADGGRPPARGEGGESGAARSEEHTSELQSLTNLVCRLLLEKKKTRDRRDVSEARGGRAEATTHTASKRRTADETLRGRMM